MNLAFTLSVMGNYLILFSRGVMLFVSYFNRFILESSLCEVKEWKMKVNLGLSSILGNRERWFKPVW